MNLLRHPVAAMVIFAILASLSVTIYTGFEETYGIQKGDTKTISDPNYGNLTTGNIMDQLSAMPLVAGVQNITAGISDLNPGSFNFLDVLGALASVGIGMLKIVWGLLIFPYSLTSLILTFYVSEVPAVIGGLAVLFGVYVAFIVLSAYLRSRV